ncbi:hypothetical protein OXX79_012064 [Metschnikowia pulcherrima]
MSSGADEFDRRFDAQASERAENSSSPLATAFTVKTNDEMMMLYTSTLVRSIIAFHDLIENKLENKKSSEMKKEIK